MRRVTGMSASKRLVKMRLKEIETLLTALGLNKIRSSKPKELRDKFHTPELAEMRSIHQMNTYGRDDHNLVVQARLIDEKVVAVWVVTKEDARYPHRADKRKRIVHFEDELLAYFPPQHLT